MPGKHRNRCSYASPSRPTKSRLTEREITKILTLFEHAKWPKRQIARELRLAESTVRAIIKRGIYTPPKQKGGPRLKLYTRKRKRLIDIATLDAYHRRLPYEEIAAIAGVQACRRTLTKAFEKERYFRRLATEKPLLTQAHKTTRLEWAQLHRHWDFTMWKRVIWTDEASIKCGSHGKVYVTRSVEEKYIDECLIPKFRNHSALMVHGSISGTKRGPLIVFNKGKINSQVYCDQALPRVYQFYREMQYDVGFMRPILMEDNASVHTAKATQSYHAYHGVLRMKWPANSPDLNPIENLWQLLKHRVGRHFPKDQAEVDYWVQVEWNKLDISDFKSYIESMPKRCQAVIDAEGGATRW